MGRRGIDISQHNGNIDFDRLKDEVDFAILRLGWIGNKNNHTLDTKFHEYYNECKRVGIPVGVYVYVYSKSVEAAERGARWVLNWVEKGDIELPVYIDMEDAEIRSVGKRVLTDMVIAFNNIIESAGLWAGTYANLDWWRNYLIEDELIPRYTSWIAHYGVNPDKYEGQYDMLQYTSSGRVDGINGNVDMNNMYRDLIEEMNGGSEPQPTPEPTPAKKSNEEIADEVIDGQWGNGEERRIRLTEAGYDYDTIQAIVNDKLGYHPDILEVGTRVKTIAQGKASSDGSGRNAKKGMTGTITRIVDGASYPYLVGDIGWYKKEALEVI